MWVDKSRMRGTKERRSVYLRERHELGAHYQERIGYQHALLGLLFKRYGRDSVPVLQVTRAIENLRKKEERAGREVERTRLNLSRASTVRTGN